MDEIKLSVSDFKVLVDSSAGAIDFLSLLTAVILAAVAIIAAAIAYLTYRNQTDPLVVVYATPDYDRPTVINLIIENIGRGVAKNISFELSEQLPVNAFGLSKIENEEWMTSGPLVNGIPALGPGAHRIITWGQYGGLHDLLGDKAIEVNAVFYRNGVFRASSLQQMKHCSLLEVSSFGATSAADNNWQRKQARQLEHIARELKAIARSSRKPRGDDIE